MVYIPPPITPGTPSTYHAHDRRVYTVLPQDGLTAVDHRVTELFVSVTGIYRRCCPPVLLYVSVAVRPVHAGEARLCAVGCVRVNIVDHAGLHRCAQCAPVINNVHISHTDHDAHVDSYAHTLGNNPSVSPFCQELSTYER